MRRLEERLLDTLFFAASLSIGAEDRGWLDAVRAESAVLPERREAWLWAAGALPLLARLLLRRLFSDLPVIPVALATGVIMAAVDLSSTERWPAALLSLAFTAALSFAYPRWAWRWAFAVTLVLPLAVDAGIEGPYANEPFDSYYKVPQALLMAGVGVWLRFRWQRRRTAG